MSEHQHATFHITGMTCASCSQRVEKVLNKMDGVQAQVNLATEKANIDYDPAQTNVSNLTERIEKLGYGVDTKNARFDIYGMTCASCSSRIEKILNKQAAIE